MSDRPPQPRFLPASTYRIQLNGGFTFAGATALVPYLARLGIGACYTSPFLTARAGSQHGYDISDHSRLNPELGTEAEYAAFSGALVAHGLLLVLDIVPNHMVVDPRTNPWWRDVLENGPSSQFARFFDIDWEPVKPELRQKILLPVLGDQYGRVLERGELQLTFEEGRLSLAYVDHWLPINPRQSVQLLRHDLDALHAELTDEDPQLREFLSILTALQNLPAHTETDPQLAAERHRETEVSRERLGRLMETAPRIRTHIEAALRAYNGRVGDAASFNLLHGLLDEQPYRLSYWRTASQEINYRRFFDINELAALRMEDPDVFAATHVLVSRLLGEGTVHGLRIDHSDGLFDPAQYFQMVQDLARHAWAEQQPALEPASADSPRPLFVVAEKVLSGAEVLPPAWPIHGTTGYNFANDVTGLFIDAEHERTLRKTYVRVTGRQESFRQVVYESKKLIMETAMASELNVLAHALNRLSERNRRSRDFTLNSLRDVLAEVIACFPVYRTYVDANGWTAEDREIIDTAVRRARRRSAAMEATIFDFVREVLLPRHPEPVTNGDATHEDPLDIEALERRDGYAPIDEGEYHGRLRFARTFQQYTGPVQAKGLEDTAFYRYNLLLSLNEVGGDPERFGRSPADFHAASLHRLQHWPFEMLTTATHDTKLGEDVRARLNVVSELPDEWRRELSRWTRINNHNRTAIDGEPAPDRNDEYRFYQVLLGTWPSQPAASDPLPTATPSLVARLRDYMRKATKEAKLHTSWINDNQLYDDALERFVVQTLTGAGGAKFLPSFVAFHRRIARLGMVNSLSQVVLKIASPGVPDFYQGTELWDFSLVDPDNRRPVDFAHRARLLEALEPLLEHDSGGPDGSGSSASTVASLLDEWEDGRIKLYTTARGLRLRQANKDLFLNGEYLPLDADITVPAGVVAFARVHAGRCVVALVPRLVTRITSNEHPLPIGPESWKTSRVQLPAGVDRDAFRNVLTGETVRPARHNGSAWLFVGDVLRTCPVALLVDGK